MLLKNKNCTLLLDDVYGRLLSLKNGSGKEFIAADSRRSLLELNLRDREGNPVLISSNSAKASFEQKEGLLIIRYRKLNGLDFDAELHVKYSNEDSFFRWTFACTNRTDYAVEWISLPVCTVPNDLIGNGGTANLLYPFSEGVLIEDASLRDRMGYKYHPVEYPSRGLEGLYPGSVCSPFMAYCSPEGGLYIGAHDPEFGSKTLEYRIDGSSLELEIRLFSGSGFGDDFALPYEVNLGTFEGDWMNAADIYRSWLDCIVKKEEDSRPAWLFEPLLVVTYPVRGTHDMDIMEPNAFYPYTNGLKYIKEIAEKSKARILVLLMHWEGSAPWAPPYVWPPYGDQEDFKKFIEELHKLGHLIGVYASGIGWSLRSKVVDYNGPELPGGAKLGDVMCKAPDGSLPFSKICCGHRDGYDLCPTTETCYDIVRGEIMQIADAGIDYVQYFDQNMGGGPCLCYAQNHGHPPMPGNWLSSAMNSLMQRITAELKERNLPLVVGCEGGAAETFIDSMRFNDLRFNVGMFAGKPVPLYAYLYHERLFNFMGNQVCSGWLINNTETPESLLFRIAYSFVAGDIPTLVLKDKAEVHWAWGTKWEIPAPEQEPVYELLRAISEFKKSENGIFLTRGRMIREIPVECEPDFVIKLQSGDILKYPSVLSSRWSLNTGKDAQLFVNYTKSTQKLYIRQENLTVSEYKIAPLSVGIMTGSECAEEENDVCTSRNAILSMFLSH